MTASDSVLAPLDGRSPTLFLVAGGLLAVFAALLGYEALANTAAPEDVFGPPGFLFAMVGLLGLYPTLADRTPRLARAGAVVAAVSAVGWFAITVLAIGEVAGVIPALEAVGPLGPVVIVAAGGTMVLAYLVFGAASLRTGVYARTVGLLVLAPPVIFGVMLLQAVLFAQFGQFSESTMAWSAVAIGGGQALVHLGIGYRLQIEGGPTDHGESRADPTA